MTRFSILYLFLLSCSTDVSIMKHPGEPSQEDSSVIIDEPSQPGSEPSQEPSSEMTDLTVGFGEIHFRQIACPACVGEPSEFDISAQLKLHYPTFYKLQSSVLNLLQDHLR